MRMYIYLFQAVFCQVLSDSTVIVLRWMTLCKGRITNLWSKILKEWKHKKNGQISWFQVGYDQWLERFYVAETEV